MTEVDVRIFLFVHHALRGWIGPMGVLSAIGGGWGSLFVVPLFLHPRTRLIARPFSLVLAATALLVFVLKRLVERVRPCNCLPDVRALVFAPPSDFSFPSGHAAGSFAFTVFLAIALVRTAPREPRGRRLRWACAALLVALAVAVGLSRIALGVHFPGDVVAGAILGTTVAAVGARVVFGPAPSKTS